MKPSRRLTSTCRSCRYYNHEGRRGGFCRQLNVLVQGGWSACSLALPPFAPSWESVEEIMRSMARNGFIRAGCCDCPDRSSSYVRSSGSRTSCTDCHGVLPSP